MPKIAFGGRSYDCNGVSVLDCLTAHGVEIPSSCHSGVCQTCLMQADSGDIPKSAQSGLKPTLIEQNYFMACSCHPETDMEVSLPVTELIRHQAVVSSIERLSHDIAGVRIQPPDLFKYKAGQFINLHMNESVSRSYSLASVPELGEELYLHVRRIPGGQVSNWIFDVLKAGDRLTISSASGDCFYVPGTPEQDIVLIGTGSGLAPLYGIARDALRHQHRGKISLYHGSYNSSGLYLVDQLKELDNKHDNFSYIPCLSDDYVADQYSRGMVLDVALSDLPSLAGWRVFLCGNPEMVKSAKTRTFLAGASSKDIFSDPFG